LTPVLVAIDFTLAAGGQELLARRYYADYFNRF
jgi:hypothetical protein